jgi:transcriptional regulator with XRE-family HTH domain
MEGRTILAKNMKRIRKERGISQEDLAHMAQIDRTYVSALERRLYAASIDVIDKIAEALSVRIDVLFQISKD